MNPQYLLANTGVENARCSLPILLDRQTDRRMADPIKRRSHRRICVCRRADCLPRHVCRLSSPLSTGISGPVSPSLPSVRRTERRLEHLDVQVYCCLVRRPREPVMSIRSGLLGSSG